MNHAATLAQDILHKAVQANASDIHFYPFGQDTAIYFRIHGKRILHETITCHEYQLLLVYFKFTSNMDIGELRKPQNGKMTFNHDDTSIHYDLRLSTLPVNDMESLAIRILPQDQQLQLHQLFLFPFQLDLMKRWMRERAGLILLTGPTGSGKTTTLYSLLEAILQETSYQMITLEDPIEKNMNHILQVQVNEKAGITYQTGLKAALRHDPDIIMIGEIRDRHIAKFAFEASLTGHLVLSTLHAKNAQGTIHRLKEMGLTQEELKQSLIAVGALQLLPIQYQGKIMRRAAIMEAMDGKYLDTIIKGGEVPEDSYGSFHQLRKKAYAYGFIAKEDL